MKLLDECPICRSRGAVEFLRRDNVPTHQNLLFEDEPSARSIKRGTLALHVCPSCGFVFNAAFDANRLSYGRAYDNTQTCSPRFLEHTETLARRLLDEHGLAEGRIVEVGCGKGQFLERLVSPGTRNEGWGFDPSYTGAEDRLGGRLRFRRENFGPDAAAIGADAIVCRHVIEHVSDPRALVATMRNALAGSASGRLFLETPCVEWILSGEVIWDFFYEHCSYFSPDTLASCCEAEGFEVENVGHVFGGQYLWLEARVGRRATSRPRTPGRLVDLARSFGVLASRRIEGWRRRAGEIGGGRPVALWGAGAKGVTFANLIDPEARAIDCVIDLNPNKSGRFLPGTGHPIVSPDEAARRGVAAAILMNPNYRREVLELLEARDLPISLPEISLA